MSVESDLIRAMLDREDTDVTPELREALLGMIDPGGTVIEGEAVELTATASPPNIPKIDLARWKQDAARSERIIEALAAKLEMLACALGACPLCWGSDGPCEGCGGHSRGGPGAFLPDPTCFDTFVAPALRIMIEDRPRAPRSSLPTQKREN